MVIIGAGISVGKFVVQLARIAGIETVITISSPASMPKLRAYGATHTLDRHGTNVAQKVKEIVQGELKHVIDCYTVIISKWGSAGKMVSLLSAGSRIEEGCDAAAELEEKNILVTGVHGSYSYYPDPLGNWAASLPQWLDEVMSKTSELKIVNDLKAKDISSALNDMREQVSGAKYVVQLRE